MLITALMALAAACLGLVFLGSAVPKLRHPKGFLLTVLAYEALPIAFSRMFAWMLPVAKLLCAILLLCGVATRIAAIIAACLLTSFLYAICLNLARGRSLECHCFGSSSHRRISPGLAAQDFALLGLAIGLVVVNGGWWSLEPWSVFRLPYLLPSTSAFQHLLPTSGESLVALVASIIVALILAVVLRVWPSLQARRASS